MAGHVVNYVAGVLHQLSGKDQTWESVIYSTQSGQGHYKVKKKKCYKVSLKMTHTGNTESCDFCGQYQRYHKNLQHLREKKKQKRETKSPNRLNQPRTDSEKLDSIIGSKNMAGKLKFW